MELLKRTDLTRIVQLGQGQWQDRMKNVRSWGDFFDRNRFSKPENITTLKARIIQNVSYYQSNYACVFAIMVLYTLLTNLLLLFVLLFLVGGALYAYRFVGDNGLAVFGRTFTKEQIYKVLAISSIPLLYFGSVGYTIFWLLGVSTLIIALHASFAGPCLEMEFSSDQV